MNFGAIPAFAPQAIQGISILCPVAAEFMTEVEASTPAAQLFNPIQLMESARIGTVLIVWELRPLNPEVVADAAAAPPVVHVPAEVGPLPICFANLAIPAGAYLLVSANSINISLLCILDLYNTANFPVRCLRLPVGTDVLPLHLTIPASCLELFFAMSSEGLRWMELDPAARFVNIVANSQAANIFLYSIPAILAVPVPGAAPAAPSTTATGLVTAANANPSFRVGSTAYSAVGERQDQVFANARAMHIACDCNNETVVQLCGGKDPCTDAAISILKTRVPLELRSCAFYHHKENFKIHVLQNFTLMFEETSPGSNKFTGGHLAQYLPRLSDLSPVLPIPSIDKLVLALTNWRNVTCATHTPNAPADKEYFRNLVSSTIQMLEDISLEGGMAHEDINAVVYFVSKLMVEYGAIFRREDYKSQLITVELRSIFPNECLRIFHFTSERNQAAAALMHRTPNQQPFQFPINKTPAMIAKAAEDAATTAAALIVANNNSGLKRGYNPDGSPASLIPQGSPGPNHERNVKKRLKTKELKAATAANASTTNVAANTRSGANSNKKVKNDYCCNNFADQVQESASFPTGIPVPMVRVCANGANCDRKHFTVNLAPGTLDKGIAASLIKGATIFGNAGYKENFFRVVKLLSK